MPTNSTSPNAPAIETEAGLTVKQTADAILPALEPTPEPEAAPAASAPVATPASIPAAQLPSLDTPEGRIVAGYATGTVPYTASDVESVKDRLTPDEYHDLHATAVIHDRERERQITERQQQLDRLASRVPEVSDPQTRRQFTDELSAYVEQFDYGRNELLNVNDSRAIELARHGLRQTQRVRELEQQLAKERAGVARQDEDADTERPTRRRTAPRIAPEELKPMGIHGAKKLLEGLVE